MEKSVKIALTSRDVVCIINAINNPPFSGTALLVNKTIRRRVLDLLSNTLSSFPTPVFDD